MPNPRIFSDLPPDDLIQLKRLLENLLIDIDGIAGIRAILRNAGIDSYFIASLYLNSNINEFITILVSKFKVYPVSNQRLYHHPLMALLEYVLKQRERYYNLEDTDIEIAKKIISIGKGRIEELKREKPTIITPPSSTIDILIITALKDELDALKNCDNQFGNTWQEFKDSLGYPYYKTTLSHKNGTQLNIVAARPPEMGEINTSIVATRLVSELKPRYLAMTGICAGNKKEVFLGDVIVADRVFKFDSGKLVAHYKLIDNQQVRIEEMFPDIHSYNLNPKWKFAIKDFPQDWQNTIQTPRPIEDKYDQNPLIPKVHIGVVATNGKVQKDPQLFQSIGKLQGKILGVEMEAAAICAVGEIYEIPVIVIKGVQDYADYDKNDQFRKYAAEVSARFLLAFLTTI
ncbi:MAG: hypothetical protein AAGJ08_17795 [Cyanobacteria bacterium P01_H01_bin.35]